MSSIASSVNRVPNLLRTTTALSTINRTNLELFRVSQQLSTGLRITRPSQDSMAAALISSLDFSLESTDQLARNLTAAAGSLDTLDSALEQTTNLLLDARDLALGQLNIATSAEERAGQAAVIDSILQSMLGFANTRSEIGSVFAGSRPGSDAVEAFGGGYRYLGDGPGLETDLGRTGSLPVTLGGRHVLGSTSTRVQSVTISPDLTGDTRLDDLRGARGLGISRGLIELAYDGNASVQINLSGADTIQDVADRIEAALIAQETTLGVTILGPNGVSVGTDGLVFDLDSGGGSNPQVTIVDIGAGTTGADLGLTADSLGGSVAFSAANTGALGLDPVLTDRSGLTNINGTALGSIRLSANDRSIVVDLSGVETFGDLRNAIEATGLGVRVEINEDKSGFAVVHEVAGGAAQALSIEEVPGNNSTATLLGIRTLGPQTLVSSFNDGRGVEVVEDADPVRSEDFRITLGDGTELNIDLNAADLATVQSLLDTINQQADAQLTALGRPTTDFSAGLSDGPNGIAFTQDSAVGGVLVVSQRNNSPAAEQLGLLEGTFDATTSTLLGKDRAKVRVDNVFTHLVDLRDALLTDDTFGIGIATTALNVDLDRVAEARGLVGGLARRVDQEQELLDDRRVTDLTLRSTLRDVDFAEAATRLTLLQTQLQAAYQTTTLVNSLNLLDFLG